MVGIGIDAFFPKRCAGRGIECGNDLFAGFGIGRGDEETLVPDDGRAVADAGERLFPQEVGRFPFGGYVGIVALAGAVGAAEAVPVSGECAGCNNEPERCADQDGLTQGRGARRLVTAGLRTVCVMVFVVSCKS